jgi:hypothetical protein
MPTHRCPRNFPIDDSSKSIESRTAVQHCTALCRRMDVMTSVCKLVTDDDSTTRANLQHSLFDIFNAIYGVDKWKEKMLVGRVTTKENT